jgi:hypothetical protein
LILHKCVLLHECVCVYLERERQRRERERERERERYCVLVANCFP